MKLEIDSESFFIACASLLLSVFIAAIVCYGIEGKRLDSTLKLNEQLNEQMHRTASSYSSNKTKRNNIE